MGERPDSLASVRASRNLPAPEILVRGARAAERWLRDRLLGRPRDRFTVREDLARTHLRGSGIEIGPLNLPLRMPPWTHVRYVDYLPVEALSERYADADRYPDLAGAKFVAPDVLDDGERLDSFTDDSQDFVVANHFIEHSEDPIGTLATHLRVTRPGGIVFHALPDKRWTFDNNRPITALEHLIRDHEEGPQVSRREHYLEWATLVDGVPSDEAERYARDLEEQRFSIHFHVWTPPAYLGLLLHCQAIGLPFRLELFQENESEFITVLRKTHGNSGQA